jgi:hypothetical protein
LADDALKERRTFLVNGCLDSSGGRVMYKGDAYSVFTASKVMSFLAFAQMGISSFKLTAGSAITRLPINFSGQGGTELDSLLFLVSCLFACLDCMCDLKYGSEIIYRICSCIGAVYANASALMTVAEPEVCSFAEKLGSESLRLFAPTLIRSFRLYTNSVDSGPNDSIHFRSFLAALRGIISLAAKTSLKTSPTARDLGVSKGQTEANGTRNNAEEPESDDVWGDLDDAAFANFDLGGVAQNTNSAQDSGDGDALGDIWKCLINGLECAKVSLKLCNIKTVSISSRIES